MKQIQKIIKAEILLLRDGDDTDLEILEDDAEPTSLRRKSTFVLEMPELVFKASADLTMDDTSRLDSAYKPRNLSIIKASIAESAFDDELGIKGLITEPIGEEEETGSD